MPGKGILDPVTGLPVRVTLCPVAPTLGLLLHRRARLFLQGVAMLKARVSFVYHLKAGAAGKGERRSEKADQADSLAPEKRASSHPEESTPSLAMAGRNVL